MSPAETREVAKCVASGRVTYTKQGDCQSGTRVTVRITGAPTTDELRVAQIRGKGPANTFC
jgi:hypothetical protein